MVSLHGRRKTTNCRTVNLNQMKQLIIITLLLLQINGHAQTVSDYSSEADYKRYFTSRILQLDPIEGFYDIQTTIYFFNAFGIYNTQNINEEGVIYKSGNQYILKIKSSWKISFTNIGSTNAYNTQINFLQVGESQTQRVIVQNGLTFNLEYTIPHAQAQIEFQNRNALAGLKFSHNLIKTYPSPSVIESAKQAQIEKETREQEMQQQAIQKNALCSGSGFLLAPNGYIATNYHVIENANSIQITGLNQDFNKQYNAEIIATDPNNDIAILKIEDSTYKNAHQIPYNLQNTTLELGQPCYTLGYPLITTMGVDIKLTNGIISSKTGFQGDVAYYQISVPIQPGNSGGPLFDKMGNIIGIVSAKHTDAENVGYAVKSSYLYNLIETLPSPLALSRNTTLINKSLSEQVKLLRNYVCLILVNASNSASFPEYVMTKNTSFLMPTPSPASSYIGIIPRGTRLYCIAKDRNYYLVKFQGQTGYIAITECY